MGPSPIAHLISDLAESPNMTPNRSCVDRHTVGTTDTEIEFRLRPGQHPRFHLLPAQYPLKSYQPCARMRSLRRMHCRRLRRREDTPSRNCEDHLSATQLAKSSTQNAADETACGYRAEASAKLPKLSLWPCQRLGQLIVLPSCLPVWHVRLVAEPHSKMFQNPNITCCFPYVLHRCVPLLQ